jgi:hypothetical protein
MAVRPGLCDTCAAPSHERVETATGRLVCQDCADDITASTAAVLTGAPGLAADVGEAIAIRGWIRRMREWRTGRRGQRPDCRS